MYDRLNEFLVLGRGMHIAANETDSLTKSGDTYTYQSGTRKYTIKDGVCTCEAYVQNGFRRATEAQGQAVGPYPGLTCLHVKAVALLEGKPVIGGKKADDLDATTEERQEMNGGWTHQAAKVEARKNPVPVGKITARKLQPRVPVLAVRAKEGYTIDLGNDSTASVWKFGLNGLDKDEALEAAKEQFPEENYTFAFETANEDWASGITPIA